MRFLRYKKTVVFIVSLVLILAVALAGCGSSDKEQNQGGQGQEGQGQAGDATVTVTDMMGRQVTLDEPAERIVALTPSDCEILYAIGAGEALVGRGEYCDYPAQVESIPAVASGAETNVEQVIALSPQVVVMSSMAQSEEQIAALETAGIKVVVSDVQDIDGVYTAIEMIGSLSGHETEAKSLVEEMKETFARVAEKSTGDGSKTVYFEVSPLEYGLWAAGSNTFMNEVAEMVGLTNAFADVQGWGQISEEQVIQRNPDYIVTVAMYFGDGPTPEEEIRSRAGWSEITAVKQGAILNIRDDELSRPGPRLADGANMLFELVYGADSK